jgi:hypothetical protein
MSIELYLPLGVDLTDKSGNARNGTATLATFQNNTGVKKGSYYISASTGRINIGAFALPSGLIVSLSTWVKIGSQTTVQVIFNKGYSNGVGNLRFYRVSNSTSLIIAGGKTGGTTSITVANFFTTENVWMHIGIVENTTANTFSVYRNGDLVITSSPPDALLAVTANTTAYIGGETTANRQIIGNICETKLIDGLWNARDFKNEYMLTKGMLINN